MLPTRALEGDRVIPSLPQGLSLSGHLSVGPRPQLLLDSSPDAVRIARHWVEAFVSAEAPGAPEEHVHDVVLAVSELVTNAVRYGTEPGDSLRIVLDVGPGSTRVEVHDPCRRPPRRRPASDVRSRGRGLLVLDALAYSWGVAERPMGKAVWAEVRWVAAS
ncbi:ATP-binding protein [Streptomyces polychromogenes]|uniref:ATP-binding protein n=1 Tax=Streptomyces polychromogenes TaxID=67342 RepID=A0ABP3F6L6_9ACTN